MDGDLKARIDLDFFALLRGRAETTEEYKIAKNQLDEKYKGQLHSMSDYGMYGRICQKYMPLKNGNSIAPQQVERTNHNERKFSFADLVQYMVENTGELPGTKWLNTLAVYFGLSAGNGSANVSNLKGAYEVTRSMINGFVVTKKVDPIEEELRELRARIDELERKRRA